MNFFNDTFEVGDKVTWRSDYYKSYALSLDDDNQHLKQDEFTITKVEPVKDYMTPVAGHTQHVNIEGYSFRFSGAFFKAVTK